MKTQKYNNSEETRIALLEQKTDSIDGILLRIERKIDNFDAKFEKVYDKIDSKFNFLFGWMVTLFLINGGLLAFAGKFLK